MAVEILHILLVEDNPDDANLIYEFLNINDQFNIEFHREDRLANALRYLESNQPNVILYDLSLPDASGIQGFLTLHKKHPHLPIVILTGLDDNNTAVEAVSNGAQDYVNKNDIEPNLLARTIHYAIERKRAEAAVQEADRIKILAQTAVTAGHLINQPLQSILGYCDLLTTLKDIPPEKLAQYIQNIREAGVQISDIVSKMEKIERHVTATYVGHTDMIDLDASASENT
jgi:DNA-binding NarL/FixJ family response regulator